MIKTGYNYYVKYLESKVSAKGTPYTVFQISEKKTYDGTTKYYNYQCFDFSNPKLIADARAKVLKINSVDTGENRNGKPIFTLYLETEPADNNFADKKPSDGNLPEHKEVEVELPF